MTLYKSGTGIHILFRYSEQLSGAPPPLESQTLGHCKIQIPTYGKNSGQFAFAFIEPYILQTVRFLECAERS